MEQIKLKTNTINKVLDYLAKQPFIEVYQLISEIQKEGEENGPTESKGE